MYTSPSVVPRPEAEQHAQLHHILSAASFGMHDTPPEEKPSTGSYVCTVSVATYDGRVYRAPYWSLTNLRQVTNLAITASFFVSFASTVSFRLHSHGVCNLRS